MAGLPGTGLGGIFYAVLIIWMAVREIWLILRGARSQGRWRAIAKFNAILAVIVVVLGAEFWAIDYAARNWILPPLGPSPSPLLLALRSLAPALVLAPFLVLAALLVLLESARWLARAGGETKQAIAVRWSLR